MRGMWPFLAGLGLGFARACIPAFRKAECGVFTLFLGERPGEGAFTRDLIAGQKKGNYLTPIEGNYSLF